MGLSVPYRTWLLYGRPQTARSLRRYLRARSLAACSASPQIRSPQERDDFSSNRHLALSYASSAPIGEEAGSPETLPE